MLDTFDGTDLCMLENGDTTGLIISLRTFCWHCVGANAMLGVDSITDKCASDKEACTAISADLSVGVQQG